MAQDLEAKMISRVVRERKSLQELEQLQPGPRGRVLARFQEEVAVLVKAVSEAK